MLEFSIPSLEEGQSIVPIANNFDFSTRYGVSNIRELLGHKVDLNFIESNPAVRLEKD